MVLKAPERQLTGTLAEKLETVLRDVDLSLALGPYLTQVILPAMQAQGKLTPEERERLTAVRRQVLDSLLNDDERQEVKRAARRRRDEVSPFA